MNNGKSVFMNIIYTNTQLQYDQSQDHKCVSACACLCVGVCEKELAAAAQNTRVLYLSKQLFNFSTGWR